MRVILFETACISYSRNSFLGWYNVCMDLLSPQNFFLVLLILASTAFIFVFLTAIAYFIHLLTELRKTSRLIEDMGRRALKNKK